MFFQEIRIRVGQTLLIKKAFDYMLHIYVINILQIFYLKMKVITI